MRFLIPRACGGCVEFEPTHGGHGVRTYGGRACNLGCDVCNCRGSRVRVRIERVRVDDNPSVLDLLIVPC